MGEAKFNRATTFAVFFWFRIRGDERNYRLFSTFRVTVVDGSTYDDIVDEAQSRLGELAEAGNWKDWGITGTKLDGDA